MTGPASTQRVEIVRRGYAALERGDLDAVVAQMAAEVEFRNPQDAIEGGTRRGREAVKEALGALAESFGEMRFEILDSAEVGDATAFVVRFRGRGRSSGAPLDQHFGHVFRFAEDTPAAVEWYNDPAEALEAIGASEWARGGSTGS